MSNDEKSTSGEKNKYLITAVIAVIVGAGGFLGGMKYQESKMPRFTRNLPENLSQMREQFGQRPGGVMAGLRPVNGKIISEDEKSITVELADGSSKIILLTESSVINKTEEGSTDDLSEGTQIVVFGQENSDGSITAQNIQIGNRDFREQFQESN